MYTIVTNDEYELPLGVFDTLLQVAEALGITEGAAQRRMSRPPKDARLEKVVYVGRRKKKMTEEERIASRKKRQAIYRRTHDRSEYFRQRYLKKKEAAGK